MNSNYLKLAVDTAREAGKLLRESRSKLLGVHERIAHDVKLEADRESERLIRHRLEATGLPIIGEEFGGDAELLHKDELYWAVDPLDGTVNYSFGLPMSCSCIGLWKGTTPVLGAVYDFWRDEMFVGEVGKGATLNGQPIKLSAEVTVKKDVIASIIPTPNTDRAPVLKLEEHYRLNRNLGSCALALAYLAAGRLGAFYEGTVKIWDIAAALAIVKAAGGEMSVKPLQGYHLEVSAAWNKALMPKI